MTQAPAEWTADQEEDQGMDQARYDKGMQMRRKVLGDEYVDRAVANTDDFNRDFQALLTEYCWGAVWGDDALKPRERSILNLGMIACLGRMHEFEAHFRGALRNGLTPKELSAILRQIAVYCGFPAAVDAHRVAKQVLASAGGKS
jgi:4-carboxymuconolactone decarboxylase